MDKYRLSDLIINEVISSARLTSAAGAKKILISRNNWAALLKVEGKTVYRTGGEQIVSDSHHPVILSAGSNYEWECTETGDFLIIEFSCDRRDGKVYSFELPDNSVFIKNFSRIERSRATHPDSFKAADLQCIYAILVSLIDSSYESNTSSRKLGIITPAAAYMSERYFVTDINNDMLAELCGISTVYFRKLFTSVFSVSPMQYLKSVRIEKAKTMLLGDGNSVTDIAESVGYSDIYQFSKAFKSSTGLSPSEYAKRSKR